ncbi:MAG: c-type cytochrome [Deltaproteobacteria bacterium]|nr:c-type cytochrome [Deltaproteobacteria bacterium]
MAAVVPPRGGTALAPVTSRVSAGLGMSGAATSPADIKVPPGFKVERLYSAQPDKDGSWISLAVDNKGRLITSSQHHRGLFRITLPAGPQQQVKVERLKVDVGHAHGLLYAFDSLYVVSADDDKDRNGLYRLRDTNNDDQFDKVEFLKPLRGQGEHGPHAVVLGPDKESLFIVGGNFTKLPADISTFRSPAVWGDDQLLPQIKDPSGGTPKPSPGGWVLRTDRDGKTWELFANGLRNAYDIAFNSQGDLLTYDSDMEWDLGTSWYRPPRVCLVTSGADFGWRIGTANWPDWNADSLSSILDTGPASPTGVVFGYGARFPARYQNAMFALDWTYGTIHAVFMEPQGSAYAAKAEPFVVGSPLPVTDAVVHPDGAFYFITGGRKVQSGLYRITYVGTDATDAVKPQDTLTAAQTLRRTLEGFHGKVDPKAVEAALPHFGSRDRFLRSAARLAVEAQPVVKWRKRVLQLTEPQAVATGMLALARHGVFGDQAVAVNALLRVKPAKATPDVLVELLRAYALIFVRLGKPTPAQAKQVVAQLEPLLPSQDDHANVELARVLAYLNAPTVVPKTVALMASAAVTNTAGLAELAERNQFYGATVKDMVAMGPQTQRMLLASTLRNVQAGWTTELQRQYLKLIDAAMTSSRGGNMYYGAWQMIREEFVSHLSPADKKKLAALVETPSNDAMTAELPSPVGPGSLWTVFSVWERLESDPKALKGRNFENGRRMFSAATCVLCHRVGNEGGAVGPDLTGLGARFSVRDLLDSIINPSAVISDQYQAAIVTKKNGETLGGRLIREDDTEIVLMPNMFNPQALVPVPRADVAKVEPSTQSQMPGGLINSLNWDELRDLLAFLVAGGDPQHPSYTERP